MENENTNSNPELLYEQEAQWLELVRKWLEIVQQTSDYGYLESEFTNSVYGAKCFEWGHYGYSRREHQYIEGRFDLDFNNACLIKYTVRQSDYALGPSANVNKFLAAGLGDRGYTYLGTTSDDENGTHLTYWYIKEFCEPKDNPDFDYDEDY